MKDPLLYFSTVYSI